MTKLILISFLLSVVVFAEDHVQVSKAQGYQYYNFFFNEKDGAKYQAVTDLRSNTVYARSMDGGKTMEMVIVGPKRTFQDQFFRITQDTVFPTVRIGDGSVVPGSWVYKDGDFKERHSQDQFVLISPAKGWAVDVTKDEKKNKEHKFTYVFDGGTTSDYKWTDPKKTAIEEVIAKGTPVFQYQCST